MKLSQFNIEKITSKDLADVYNHFLAIENMVNYVSKEAKVRLQRDKKFLYTIEFPFIGLSEGKNKINSISQKFDDISQFNRENAILNIVAKFEKVVFEKITKTSILIRTQIEDTYSIGQPMHNFRSSFIKNEDDIFNLSKFNNFLSNHENIAKELEEIILFRNHLAHGKRPKVGSDSNMTLEQIIQILDKIIKLL